MAETLWKGTWWINGLPDDTRPGTLHYEDSGRLRLELIGGFGIAERTETSPGVVVTSLGGGEWPLLHGAAGGERFTLIDCLAAHTSGGSMSKNVAAQTITSTRGLRGIWLDGVERPVFNGLSMQFEYLIWFAAATSMQVNIDFGTSTSRRWTGEQAASSLPVADRTAEHDGYQFTLLVPHTMFQVETKADENYREVSSREFGLLKVHRGEASSLGEFDRIARSFQDLLTLAAGAPAAMLRRKLTIDSQGEQEVAREIDVEVMGRLLYQPGSQPGRDPRIHGMFGLDTVDFETLIPRWMTLHSDARFPLNLLFGTQYLPEGYTGNRLMTIAASAEGLHRYLHDFEPMSGDEFDAAKQAALDALAGEGNKKARALIHQQLHNAPTYGERLEGLTRLIDPEIVQLLLTDVESWSRMLTRARNGTAHADDRRPGARPDGHASFWLTRVTYAFLMLVLMSEVGIPGEILRSAIEKPELIHARGEFRKLVAADEGVGLGPPS